MVCQESVCGEIFARVSVCFREVRFSWRSAVADGWLNHFWVTGFVVIQTGIRRGNGDFTWIQFLCRWDLRYCSFTKDLLTFGNGVLSTSTFQIIFNEYKSETRWKHETLEIFLDSRKCDFQERLQSRQWSTGVYCKTKNLFSHFFQFILLPRLRHNKTLHFHFNSIILSTIPLAPLNSTDKLKTLGAWNCIYLRETQSTLYAVRARELLRARDARVAIRNSRRPQSGHIHGWPVSRVPCLDSFSSSLLLSQHPFSQLIHTRPYNFRLLLLLLCVCVRI